MPAPAPPLGARSDFRSDTITQPTEAMRLAMARADVGDDVYGEDPSVRRLEVHVAELLGHEDALFVPTGTMGNQIALRLLVPPAQELLCDADAHVVTYEGGGAAQHGGIQTRTFSTPRGRVDGEAVLAQVRGEGYGTVVTRAVALEDTHNRGGGVVQPLDEVARLASALRDRGVALHCDGARLWNAAVASGEALSTRAAPYDTLSVCLSKGLGAPVGSLLVGSVAHCSEGRRLRHRLGGAMRQAGVLAAAGLHAVTHHLERLADDHARAVQLATALAEACPGVVDPATVETNLVLLDLPRQGSAQALATAAAEQRVLVGVLSPSRLRLVTHLDVDDADVAHAVEVLSPLLAASR